MARREHRKLAKEIVGNTRRRSVVGAFVMPIVVVLCVNFTLVPIVMRYPLNNTWYHINVKWNDLLTTSERVQLPILGGSSCLYSVIPRQLENSLGLSSWNYATIELNLLLNPAWMLAKSIEKNGPPDAVVLVIVPMWLFWSSSPELFARLPLSWRYWKEKSTEYPFSTKKQMTMAWYRYFPFYHDFNNLNKLLKHPWEISDQYRWLENKFERLEKGYRASIFDSTQVANSLEATLRQTRSSSDNWISNENAFAFDVFSKLALDNDFIVYVVSSPLHNGLVKNKGFLDYYEYSSGMLQDMIENLPGLVYLDIENRLEYEYFYDSVIHLNHEGAKIYTDSLAAALRRAMIENGDGHLLRTAENGTQSEITE